jgi:hypothetical protein
VKKHNRCDHADSLGIVVKISSQAGRDHFLITSDFLRENARKLISKRDGICVPALLKMFKE